MHFNYIFKWITSDQKTAYIKAQSNGQDGTLIISLQYKSLVSSLQVKDKNKNRLKKHVTFIAAKQSKTKMHIKQPNNTDIKQISANVLKYYHITIMKHLKDTIV